MIKKFYFLFLLLFLSNCGISGSAILGPTYTGLTTGSISQTSLSYGSSKIIEDIKLAKTYRNSTFYKNSKISDISYVDKDPVILASYKVNVIEVSEVLEPEPLP